MIGSVIKQLRLSRGMNQTELCSKLNIEQSTLANYENDKRIPKLDILVKIADLFGVSVDYMLGRESVGDVLGLDDNDEHAITFQHKLSNQIDFKGVSIGELSQFLEVSEATIIGWLLEEDDTYPSYYKKLSEFFEVSERYWTSPSAISPGIEPNMEEYLLILMKRDYAASGDLNPAYGSLEDYFPGIKVVTDPEEVVLLRDYRKMNQDSKDIVKGKCKEVLRTQRYDEANDEAMELPKASGKY